MSFLKRAIKEGISKGIGEAVEQAVKTVVEPKATEFANKAANKAANKLDEFTKENQEEIEEVKTSVNNAGGFEGLFANFQSSFESFANEATKDLKVCPNCGQPSGADKKFCPSCGTALPEETLGQGAICPSCGKQNTVGTKFCSDCGTKLPSAVKEEQQAILRDEQVLNQWETILDVYPKWNCGGKDFALEDLDGGTMFAARFDSYELAKEAVKNYRILLQENDFRPAGEYPSVEHLYKMINGKCFHVDTEHCFDGDSDCPTIYFNIGEPYGGFNYVKPEPKKPTSLKDLFKF